MFLLPFATCSPEVIHRLNRYWQPVCSIILLCPVGTSAAHTDNLVLNWEEHRLRIWSNYLYIKRPWWNWRTSDAGSARTFKWETSRELARVGWVSGGRIKSRRGLYFQRFPLFLSIWSVLIKTPRPEGSWGQRGVPVSLFSRADFSIECDHWRTDIWLVLHPLKSLTQIPSVLI